MTRVVPYVAIRAGEFFRMGAPPLFPDSPHRDHHGWLWRDQPQDMTGEALFGFIHPARQRQCMDRLRCQVCAEKVSAPITWLVPTEEIPDLGAPLINREPPICQECIAITQVQCPGMRRVAHRTVQADRVTPAGIVGEVFSHEKDRIVESDATLNQGDPRAPRTIATARLVPLEDWRLLVQQ